MHQNLQRIHDLLSRSLKKNTRDFLSYWADIHPRDRLPDRAAFDPIDIPSLLPYLVLVDVEQDSKKSFRYRLVGTEVTEIVGAELKGKYIGEVLQDSQKLLDMYERICAEQCLDYYFGQSRFKHRTSYLNLERVSLPISEDGLRVSQVISLFNYMYASKK